MRNLPQLIESILFFRSEPTSKKKLVEWLGVSPLKIDEALQELDRSFADRGVRLIYKEDEVTLGTSKEASDLIESIIKEDLHKDLGKAGLETLSIVLYLGPIGKSEIDFIRGVSSSFILRNLLMRGLIERIENPNDRRSFLYKATFELLSYLGISKVDDLPEYADILKEFEEKKTSLEEKEQTET